MTRPRPWWETYPKEYWTAAEWREARKAGAVPPLRRQPVDPAERLEMERQQAGMQPVLPGLYAEPDRDRERRRAADKALQDAGLRPKPWTW